MIKGNVKTKFQSLFHQSEHIIHTNETVTTKLKYVPTINIISNV